MFSQGPFSNQQNQPKQPHSGIAEEGGDELLAKIMATDPNAEDIKIDPEIQKAVNETIDSHFDLMREYIRNLYILWIGKGNKKPEIDEITILHPLVVDIIEDVVFKDRIIYNLVRDNYPNLQNQQMILDCVHLRMSIYGREKIIEILKQIP